MYQFIFLKQKNSVEIQLNLSIISSANVDLIRCQMWHELIYAFQQRSNETRKIQVSKAEAQSHGNKPYMLYVCRCK